jgi:hypothetical protein
MEGPLESGFEHYDMKWMCSVADLCHLLNKKGVATHDTYVRKQQTTINLSHKKEHWKNLVITSLILPSDGVSITY